MLTVGLTGGIVCGKSEALSELDKLGAYTIDADDIAHQVITPGQPAYHQIVSTFGPSILKSDQSIDRKKLGKLVFSNKESRETLNQIAHPFILEEEEGHISELKAQKNPRSPVIVVEAALMVETGSYRRYDLIIVVNCRPEIQVKRLMLRDGLSGKEALQRISSQLPPEEKIKHAQYVMENSGQLSELQEQARTIFVDLVDHHNKMQETI